MMETAGQTPLEFIQAAVAWEFGIPLDKMLGPSRESQVVLARQTAMWFVRERLKLSYAEIGRAFGERDHTTAIHSIMRHEELLTSESPETAHSAAFRNLQEKIAKRFGENAPGRTDENTLRLEREVKALHENLTAVQAKCTEQLLELRRLRPFAVLVDAYARQRRTESRGASCEGLAAAFGEVAASVYRGLSASVREAAIELAAMAVRMAER